MHSHPITAQQTDIFYQHTPEIGPIFSGKEFTPNKLAQSWSSNCKVTKRSENEMTTLIVGASGATGRLLVEQLLNRGELVKIIVRAESNLPETVRNHKNLSIIHATLLDLSDAEMAQHVKGCNAVASCLGHNMSLKGIYGHPRKLVTDAARRLCKAIKTNKPQTPVKFVLMNTAGNSNRDLAEPVSLGQKCVIWLIRILLPPHADNEKAADFLRTEIGQDDSEIEWAAVRPDSLTNEGEVTEYEVYPSPIRSAIFDPGTTSRINVGHFMTELITNQENWMKWKGQMPVIYDGPLPVKFLYSEQEKIVTTNHQDTKTPSFSGFSLCLRVFVVKSQGGLVDIKNQRLRRLNR